MKREGGGEKRGSRDKGGGRKVKGSGKGLIHILLLIEINDLIFPYKFLKIIIAHHSRFFLDEILIQLLSN